jgi:hypothetical protein
MAEDEFVLVNNENVCTLAFIMDTRNVDIL